MKVKTKFTGWTLAQKGGRRRGSYSFPLRLWNKKSEIPWSPALLDFYDAVKVTVEIRRKS